MISASEVGEQLIWSSLLLLNLAWERGWNMQTHLEPDRC